MSHQRRKALAFFAAAASVLFGLTAPPASASADRAEVSGALLAELEASGTADFIVYLKERANLSGAARAANPDARASAVFEQLTTTAERTQSDLRAELTAQKAEFKSFWIANAVWVKGDLATVNSIAAHTEVERIEQSKAYPLIEPTTRGTTDDGVKAVEWGVSNVEAPRVWSDFNIRGEGIVVANIDTGVDFDHPAVAATYRGKKPDGTFDHAYNWFDPANICAGDEPCDNNGHGTHTMGTMVGDDGAGNQVGVAPGATWFAAKGCENRNCTDTSLLASGQFVLAPTDLAGNNPRPELHADVVNNSWGGDPNDLWYQQTVAAWVAAGIFPAFANGNEGPGCGTASSPGDYPESYAVGGYDVNNTIYTNSSRGASNVDGATKPDISGPAVNVRSSVPGTGYSAFTGTSMATPHVAGTVALIWSAAPSIAGDIAATRELLDNTATDVNSLGCGGTVDDNNNFGEGRLNAYQAVNMAPRGPSGVVSGTVVDGATAGPLAGATVTIGSRSTTTDAEGDYELLAAAGEQQVTAAAYGYHSKTVTATVPEDGTVDVDFALTGAPVVTVSGTVKDGSGHGWPLYAKVSVSGRPGDPVYTDPVTGAYSFEVAGNASYTLTTEAVYPGYTATPTQVTLEGGDKTVDVTVPVDGACTAAGYEIKFGSPLISEAFDGARDGWTVNNRTTHGGWTFNDAGARGNKTGGDGAFAIADSDDLGSGTSIDTDLVTPALDLSGVAAPYLRFNSDYYGFSNGFADVDFSVDGGTSWTTLTHWTTASRRGPKVEEIPLTGAGGKANVLVRFRYQGAFAWWWQVDNVQLVNRSCDTVSGGLVVGNTSDFNTKSALNGVTVSRGASPADQGTSANGFYWLFSHATGAQSFTATRAPYESATGTVTVALDAVTRADFALKAGKVAMSPLAIEAYQPYGSTRTAKVKVSNSGSAPATVDLLERTGDFSLLSRGGAAPVERWVKGVSKGMTGSAVATAGETGQAPSYEDAWADIADFPAAIYDNATATVDGKLYSVGGGSGTGNEAKAWVYDPVEQAWRALPNAPRGRTKASAVSLGGKLHVFGGWSSSGAPVAAVDVFDPATGAWSTLSATHPAPTAATGTAVAGGKAYLVGGCLDGDCAESRRTFVFDPGAGAFSEVAAYPAATSWQSCGGIAGKVYCAGGLSGDASTKKAYVYDPAGDAWTPLPDLPLDLWASAYAGASGLLVIAGGVTNGFDTITNRAVAYDPAAGAWIELPNAQSPVYRGAGACGAYKVGGSPQPWVGSTAAELLGGLDLCGDAGDVPWLSTSPASFTIAPGATQTVTVTLSAAAVAQPGVYTAELGLRSNTPYPVTDGTVKMTVTPPQSWGKIQGKVVGSTCAGESVPVRATIRLNDLNNPGTGYTIASDATGAYAYWLPRGRYEIIVAKDGWLPQAQRQQIQPGIVSTLDYALIPTASCPVL